MAETEISVHGRKKIATLQKEFNKKFSYLHLAVCGPEARALVAGGSSIQLLPGDKSLAEVRTKVAPGDISIHGRTLVSTLEGKFDTVFGLYVQVYYLRGDGLRYYTSGAQDAMSLTALNRKGKEEGWKEGEE